ncbi:tRNA dimethylallyltransferase [bacterium BMS3Abin05]|nr:tRNA dimethylallyltransferase [bacterium BMS3Abin05]
MLVGPTAAGKTALSIYLARFLPDLTVVSADSRQVYRLMDIGTAKPSPEEQAVVPHECINIRFPNEPYSAGMFGKESREVIFRLLRENKRPLVVGGSGLYIRALLDGLFEGELTDPEIRTRLREEIHVKGLQGLYERLRKLDPESARKIHANDEQRILRALEIIEITGEPRSVFLARMKSESPFEPVIYGLTMDRAKLYQRIEARVDRMIQAGLAAEVENLRRLGYKRELRALQTVGYKEMYACLEGEISLEEAVRLIKRNTRRFAKRQWTWFRADKRIRWIEIEPETDFERLAESLAAEIKGHGKIGGVRK